MVCLSLLFNKNGMYFLVKRIDRPFRTSFSLFVNPRSRTQLFKELKPSASIVDRLIQLGIERQKASPHQQASLKREKFYEKILPGKLRILKSSLDSSQFPIHSLPEVAFIGRSNVGKSSVINMIANSKRTIVSKRPGQTRSIDFYSLERWMCLVDMPGYGFAYAPEELKAKWPSLIIDYLTKRKNLKKIFLLIDARHGFKVNDVEFAKQLDEHDVLFQVILTKCDLVRNPSDLARRIQQVEDDLKKYRTFSTKILLASISIPTLRSELRKEFLRMGMIPPSVFSAPQFETKAPIKTGNSNGHQKAKKPNDKWEQGNRLNAKTIKSSNTSKIDNASRANRGVKRHQASRNKMVDSLHGDYSPQLLDEESEIYSV